MYGRDAPWCSVGWDVWPARGQRAGAAVAMTGEPADAPAPAAGWPQAVGQRTCRIGPHAHAEVCLDRRRSADQGRSHLGPAAVQPDTRASFLARRIEPLTVFYLWLYCYK